MIKPVTFQGVFNFKSNLYALEVKSRFIDQSKANGYYKNYGSELAAQIVGDTIQIGTGAFVIQGRMNEITAVETVTPQIFNNFVGYVVARIETYHPADEQNCTLKAVINQSFEEIVLTQEDTYAARAENVNTVYELPLYSFEIRNNTITNLTKLIEPCGDYEKLKAIADNALLQAQNAVTTANSAVETANAANQTSNTANQNASNAVETAGNAETAASNAVETANNAQTIAERAENTVTTQHQQMTQEINELAEQIGEQQGTTVKINNVAQATLPFNGEVTDDAIILFLDGGQS